MALTEALQKILVQRREKYIESHSMHTFRNFENLGTSQDSKLKYKTKELDKSKDLQPYQIMKDNHFENKITEDIPDSELQELTNNIV